MPELPEVETMRRGVAPIVGSQIARIEKPRSRYRPIVIAPALPTLRRRVVGKRITSVDRAGKRVVLRLETGDALLFEPRMAGLVLIADPPNREHLRLRIRLQGDGPSELLFWDRRGLGTVQLLSEEEFADGLLLGKLGPDALEVSPAEFRTRLASSSRAIKVALLDQKAIAGVGNLYASEMLHVARIHPRTRCTALSPSQWRALHGAMRQVLEQAIAYEGSTLADGTYRNAQNRDGTYQNHHLVYAKVGVPCPTCRCDEIVRIVQAQRSTFYCPRCQGEKNK